MKLKVNLIFFIILITNSIFCLTEIPDNKIVEENLEQIKRELIQKQKTLDFINYVIQKLFDDLKYFANIIKILFILLIIFLTLLIIYLLIKNIFKKREDYKINIKKDIKEEIFDEKFLNSLIKENRFSESILYIYNFSIKFFKKNGYIYNTNMTNNEIYKKIKDRIIADYFKKIYIISEKILFNGYYATQKEANYCYDIFVLLTKNF